MLGPKSEIAIGKYGSQIPKVFLPYISKIKDVKPDGHYGFRSVAVGLAQKQGKYMSIWRQLLLEMRRNEGIWRQVFDPENVGQYDELYNRIYFGGVGREGPKNYMLIVHTLHIRGSNTIFPLLGGPDDAEEPHQVVVVVFVDSGHFIYVTLEGSYPMPPTNLIWNSK
ncbi:uncharacterized protein LOC110870444 [Helianthus annuus]|uniref:uncharacterized protein LOC110870444 n=1 Tax=Helianthus annuus TaxID=4232 RepID=UPI000B8FE7A6|nr:uncharacterized protein LOC110870444 [Helianthus annuus]